MMPGTLSQLASVQTLISSLPGSLHEILQDVTMLAMTSHIYHGLLQTSMARCTFFALQSA